jgi:putative hemolysin
MLPSHVLSKVMAVGLNHAGLTNMLSLGPRLGHETNAALQPRPGRIVPNHDAPHPVLGRMGSLEVRLATSAEEIRSAQRLRFEVFYTEMSAVPGRMSRFTGRDMDEYDAVCDHLLVLDHDVKGEPLRPAKPKVVGTYRLLRQEVAERHGGFYTRGEYDITPLLQAHPHLRFLELGRSCVLKPYRSRRTVELLWHGIWAYVLRHRVDAMLAAPASRVPTRGSLPCP